LQVPTPEKLTTPPLMAHTALLEESTVMTTVPARAVAVGV